MSNPNHDPKTGEFTTGPGGASYDVSFRQPGTLGRQTTKRVIARSPEEAKKKGRQAVQEHGSGWRYMETKIVNPQLGSPAHAAAKTTGDHTTDAVLKMGKNTSSKASPATSSFFRRGRAPLDKI